MGEETLGIGEVKGYESEKLHRVVDEIQYVTDPVYNVVPPGGVPAELGIMALKEHPVLLDASVRTGGDYGITVISPNISEAVVIVSSKVTVWGVPADPSHDRVRGKCLGEGKSLSGFEESSGIPHNEEESRCPNPEVEGAANIPVVPFLTNPTSCGEPREVKLSVDGWDNPGNFATEENLVSRSVALPALRGCEHLDFSPTITVQPDGSAGSTPTGLNVDVRVNQESTSEPGRLGRGRCTDTTVTLPAGVQLSPSAADGLQACSHEQIGYLPGKSMPGDLQFTAE